MEAPRHMGHREFPMVRSCLTPNGRVGRRQRWNRMHERSALSLGDKAAGISQMPLRASFRVPDDTSTNQWLRQASGSADSCCRNRV